MKCRRGLPQLVEPHGVPAQDLLLVRRSGLEILRGVLQWFGVEAGRVREIRFEHDAVLAELSGRVW